LRRAALALGVVAACSQGAASPDPAPPPSAPPVPPAPPAPVIDAPIASLASCERIPFAGSIDVPEASGAAWLPDGTIVVVSDSGNDGAYVTIDAHDGHVLRAGKLPLGARGDDLEGLAIADGVMWGITSSGWLRAWKPHGDGYQLHVPPYRIDPDDDCALESVNCGSNYEGLCLRPEVAASLDGCVGYAASKATGDLVCLVVDDTGRYVAAPERRIHVSNRAALADCYIGADATVWTGDNLFGRNAVRRIVKGAVVETAYLGDGFAEALTLAPDGTIYRFSDMSGTPSRVAAYRCDTGT
jgi:hypothetical protein